MARYGHQVVIGNELNNRKYQVVFVSPAAATPGNQQTDFVEFWLRIDPSSQDKEIEEDIVTELVRRHSAWLGAESGK